MLGNGKPWHGKDEKKRQKQGQKQTIGISSEVYSGDFWCVFVLLLVLLGSLSCRASIRPRL